MNMWLYRSIEIGFSDMEEYHKWWAVNEVEQIVLGVFEMVIPKFYCTKWEKSRNYSDYLSSYFVCFIPGGATPQWSALRLHADSRVMCIIMSGSGKP